MDIGSGSIFMNLVYRLLQQDRDCHVFASRIGDRLTCNSAFGKNPHA